MTEYRTGDIPTEPADRFRKAWPENRRDEMKPGRMFLLETGRLTAPRGR